MQWDDDPLDDTAEQGYEIEVEVEAPKSEDKPISNLSLNAMNSAFLYGTMRFLGFIHGHLVKILLDGGDDDNFIQARLAKFLHLEIQPSIPIKVLVGDGNCKWRVVLTSCRFKFRATLYKFQFICYLLLVLSSSWVLHGWRH